MFKKILLWTVIGLVVLVAVLAGVIALQPESYSISRSTTIAAAPETVFAQVNDFHKWDAWSPWAKLDPDTKYTYEGPSAGTGAIVNWSGNDKVGEGRMTLLESKPDELIRIKLEFFKPFAGVADSEFKFEPQSDKTKVTWTMAGHNNFIGKAFSLVMNMDKTLGGEFEKGLANLKSTVEAKN